MDETPHQYTMDEIRALFIERVSQAIDCHDKEVNTSRRQALENVAFMILHMLDGGVDGLPPFHVLPMGAPSDQRYFREKGENWFPILHIENDYDIGGILHEELARAIGKGVGFLAGAGPDTSRGSLARILTSLYAFGFSANEVEKFMEKCQSEAETSILSIYDVALSYWGRLYRGQISKEEILKMEHLLVLTTREVKEIGHAMHYALNYAHGTSGHGQLMLLAKFAEHLGFHFDEKNSLVTPDKVRVDDGLTTGQGKAGK